MATYHVATTGDNGDAGSAAAPWASPDYAVSQVSPGDIVIVHAGLYDERVIVDVSGTSGSPIVFVNAPGEARWVTRGFNYSASYVWLIGWEVWHTDDSHSRAVLFSGTPVGWRFEDWYVHHTYQGGFYAQQLSGSGYGIIRNGTFHSIGSPSTDGTDDNLTEGLATPAAPINISYMDHVLIEYIECDRAGDFIDCPNCQNIVVRNIYDHGYQDSDFPDATPNAYHRDLGQPETLDEVTEPTTDLVFESIITKDNVESDSHGVFMREYYNDVAQRLIIRGSLFHNLGSSAVVAGGTDYVHIYHNTIDSAIQQHTTTGNVIYVLPDAGPFEPVGCSLLNNVISNSGSGWASALDDDTAAGLDDRGNLVYNTPVGNADPDNTSDPSYDNAASDDFHIPSDSPAVDLALAITTISSATGSGTTFNVADGTRICDGKGVAEGDLVTIGSGSTLVRVTDVTGDAVTVDQSVSWTVGDGIYWQGRKDAGAWDYAASYAIDVAMADPVDSATIAGGAKEITLSLTNSAAIRQVELVVDNVPVDLQYDDLDNYSYELDLSGYSNGQQIRIEARAYPIGASETLYASDVATVTYSSSGGGSGMGFSLVDSDLSSVFDDASMTLTVDVTAGDLIVVSAGIVNNSAVSLTGVSDADGNSYTLTTERDSTFDTVVRSAYCLAANSTTSSLVITMTFTATATRKSVKAMVFQDDASGTITLDDTDGATGAYAGTPWSTPSLTSAGTDPRVAVINAQSGSTSTTYSSQTVGGAATELDSAAQQGQEVAYRIFAEALSAAAAVTPDGDNAWAMEALVFKATPVVATYSVSYDGNGEDSGTAPTDGSSPYEESDTVTVLGNAGSLAKTGYTFDGWNTAANGSGTDYAADATFSMPASNVTLYAQWLLNATSTNNIAATVAKTFAPRLLWRRRR